MSRFNLSWAWKGCETRAPPTRRRRGRLGAARARRGRAGSGGGLEDIAVEAAIPQNSVISEQYPDIATVVDEAVEAVPATPPAPVPPQPPEQYHSETPDVSVTPQQQPSNVNVSIRINSPGDDGPVVQINGNDNVVDVVQAPAAPRAGRPERPPAQDPPEDGAPAAGVAERLGVGLDLGVLRRGRPGRRRPTPAACPAGPGAGRAMRRRTRRASSPKASPTPSRTSSRAPSRRSRRSPRR